MRSLLAILIFALALALAPAAAATYRWVDADGHVHYSDTPHPGAEQIVVPKAQTYTAPQPPPQPEAASAKPAPSATYKAFSISSPTPGQTLWNIGGQLLVTSSLQPALHKGDTVQFFYDGKPAAKPAATSSITLSNVYRGTHTVSATVLDAEGKSLISTDTVTFYVKQHSIQKPH